MKKETIRDWRGIILGSIETNEVTGDKTVRAFSGVILGFYRANIDKTTDFNGRLLYQGDQSVALIHENAKS